MVARNFIWAQKSLLFPGGLRCWARVTYRCLDRVNQGGVSRKGGRDRNAIRRKRAFVVHDVGDSLVGVLSTTEVGVRCRIPSRASIRRVFGDVDDRGWGRKTVGNPANRYRRARRGVDTESTDAIGVECRGRINLTHDVTYLLLGLTRLLLAVTLSRFDL